LALGLENQARFYLATGRLAQAEEAIRQALDVHENMISGGHLKVTVERYKARSLACLGSILAASGRMTEGEEAYRNAIKLMERSVEESPSSGSRRAELAQTLVGLANFFRESGNQSRFEEIRRQAVSQYEKLKEDFPENSNYRFDLVRGYLALAELLSEFGRQTEADDYFRKALKVDPDDAGINNALAWFQVKTPESHFRDAALAVRLAKKATEARSPNGSYHNTLGVALYRSGDDRAAIAELEVAMRLRNGGDGYDWFFLAMAHSRLGEIDRAKTWFDRAVQWTDSNNPRNSQLRGFRVEAEAMLAKAGKR
jgi:tetratricopeptide (TPR) repeat protein